MEVFTVHKTALHEGRRETRNWRAFFFGTSVMRNVQVSQVDKRLSAPSVVQCGKEVANTKVHKYLDSNTIFVILLLHTNTVDLKWSNHHAI